MKYKNETHQLIYKSYIVTSPYKFPNDFLAATFLLSAERELWRRAKRAIRKKKIYFDELEKTGLSAYAFVLLHLAKDLYEGTHYVVLQDMCDRHLVSDKTCELVCSAIGIARNGYDYIGIKKEFN